MNIQVVANLLYSIYIIYYKQHHNEQSSACNNICAYVRLYVEMELWSEGCEHCNFYIYYQIILQVFLLVYIPLPSFHFRFWGLSVESVMRRSQVRKQEVRLNKERSTLVLLYHPHKMRFLSGLPNILAKQTKYQAVLSARKPATWSNEKIGLSDKNLFPVRHCQCSL